MSYKYIFGTEGNNSLVANLWANFKIYGFGGNDYIKGGWGHDLLFAGSGNDVVFGGWGNDRLYGESGNDHLRGGNGHDIVFAGSGDDLVYSDSGNDSLYGGEGFDHLYYGEAGESVVIDLQNEFARPMFGNINQGIGFDFITGFEKISGSRFGDSIFGDNGDNWLYGLDGNDTIFDSGGNDSVYGGLGDDRIEAGTGNNFFDGGAGSDTLSFVRSESGIYLNTSFGETSNKNGSEHATPLEKNKFRNIEKFELSENDDTADTRDSKSSKVDLQNGNDELYIGAGDEADGGLGHDTLVFSQGLAGLHFIGQGYSQTSNSGEYRYTNFETFIGSDLDDTFNIDFQSEINIYAGRGHDTLTANGSDGTALFGEDGYDSIEVRNSQNIEIYGGEGHDRIVIQDSENVTIYGEGGIDSIFLENVSGFVSLDGSGSVRVSEIASSSELALSAGGTYHRQASIFIEFENYGSYINLETGMAFEINSSAPSHISIAGFGTAFGTNRNDTLIAANEGGYLAGHRGNDYLGGGYGDDELNGGEDHDTLLGGDGADELYGSTGNDILLGQAGADHLNDGSGDDYVDGGTGEDFIRLSAGNDTLSGGAGSDEFRFSTEISLDLGYNLITDFDTAGLGRGGDLISFSRDEGYLHRVDGHEIQHILDLDTNLDGFIGEGDIGVAVSSEGEMVIAFEETVVRLQNVEELFYDSILFV